MNPHDSNPSAFAPPELPQTIPVASEYGSALDNHGQQGDTTEITYDPVPPKKTVLVSVRYRAGGRGQPSPYPLDEVEGE